MACIVSASEASPTSPTTTNDTMGHTYTDDQVAMVMGLACVTHPDCVPIIWTKCFSATKNPDVIQLHLKEQMQQWALAQGIIINSAVHFPEQLLTDIATLRFNPGGSLTSGTWIVRGLAIMCCTPYKPGIWDEIRTKEDTAKATATTWTFSEELKRAKGSQHTPPSTQGKLWLALDTFCALIQTLRGSKCNYYKALVELHLILMADTVQALRSQFTLYTIRSYFWAIINDGCDYLGKQLLKQHFALGTPKLPTSLLDDILYDVCFQRPMIRNYFPKHGNHPQHHLRTTSTTARKTQTSQTTNATRRKPKHGGGPTQISNGHPPPPPAVPQPSE
jgi:hypothetical protein